MVGGRRTGVSDVSAVHEEWCLAHVVHYLLEAFGGQGLGRVEPLFVHIGEGGGGFGLEGCILLVEVEGGVGVVGDLFYLSHLDGQMRFNKVE